MESIRRQGTTSFTIHMDYVEGERYIEVRDAVPTPLFVYDEYPIQIIFSGPCSVVLRDNSIRKAAYVEAVSLATNNDGTHCKWEGFVEIKQDDTDDFHFIENVFDNKKILNVLRWHYTKIPPIKEI